MPIALSSEQRISIKRKLQLAAEVSLKKYGVKKTTIDNLVQSVNIPKGTFYLIYPSKAILLYEVFQMKHDELQHEFVMKVLSVKDDLSAANVTNIIFEVYKKMDASFLMLFMSSGDLELVIKELPPGIIQKHIDGDEISMEKILSIIPNVNKKMSGLYSAALRLVMTSVLHKEEVGEEYYDEALKFSISGIVNQIFEEITND